VEDVDPEWLEPIASGDPVIDRVANGFQRRAARWQEIGVRPYHLLFQWECGILTTAVDIDDRERRAIVRTLRADYDGARVLVGVDETGQLVTPLIDEHDGTRSYDVRGETPEAIGQMMAEKLESRLYDLDVPCFLVAVHVQRFATF